MSFVNWIGRKPQCPPPEVCDEVTSRDLCLADLEEPSPEAADAFARELPRAPDANLPRRTDAIGRRFS